MKTLRYEVLLGTHILALVSSNHADCTDFIMGHYGDVLQVYYPGWINLSCLCQLLLSL